MFNILNTIFHVQGYFEYDGHCEKNDQQQMYIHAGMLHVCNDVILSGGIPCHGVCPKERKLCTNDRCLTSYERKECNGQCIHRDEPCIESPVIDRAECTGSWQQIEETSKVC